jgi:hypothetical protein
MWDCEDTAVREKPLNYLLFFLVHVVGSERSKKRNGAK